MERIVAKFGGSSVADAAQFRKVAAIMQADPRRRILETDPPGHRHLPQLAIGLCLGLAPRRQQRHRAHHRLTLVQPPPNLGSRPSPDEVPVSRRFTHGPTCSR